MGESKVVDEARVICMAADRSSNIKKDTDYVHKGLEHALWNEVKDAETLQEYGETLKSLKGNKAVEMMIKRRARCDKYRVFFKCVLKAVKSCFYPKTPFFSRKLFFSPKNDLKRPFTTQKLLRP